MTNYQLPITKRSGLALRKSKGFTLLELLMVVGLLGIILVAITQLLGSTIAGTGKSNALQLVKENGQFAISTMSRTARLAKSVTQCGGNILEFTVDESGTAVTYVFDLSSGRLRRTKSGTLSFVTDYDLTVSSFTCSKSSSVPGNPAVLDLSITLGKSSIFTDQSVASTTFQTTVSLRSY